jgi:hypothetical protein
MTATTKLLREAPVADPGARLRILSRLTVAFFLDAVAIVRGDRDPIDTLLISAVIQANVAELVNRADLQASFVEADEMPGDEVRRPVSMSAVASSLNLPFETVRRRINAMIKEGYCSAVDGGVIVPSAVLAAPEHLVGAFRGYERLRSFYYDLRDLGLIDGLPAPEPGVDTAKFPVRTISRLAGAYLLRVVESMGAQGDLVDAVILLETFRSNVEHFAADYAPAILDEERRPISVAALAARLGLSAETVRRRCAGLVEAGDLARVARGLVVPTSRLLSPRLGQSLAGNAANLQRLFASLARLGVLKLWDSMERPA